MRESAGKLFTRGGQIAFHNIRMFFQINKTVIKAAFWIMLLATFVLTYLFSDKEIIHTFFAMQKATLLHFLGNDYPVSIYVNGKEVVLSSNAFIKHPYFIQKSALFYKGILDGLFIAIAINAVAAVASSFYFIKKGRQQGAETFLRGSRLATSQELGKCVKQMDRESDIVIDGLPILKDSEPQHFLMHGTIGAGKSQLMMKFLEAIRRRGDRVIIYDKGLSFTTYFFDESKDVLLNPFDARCANWDMWKEAPRDSDFENMAESLIPLHGQSDPFWVDAARTVFSSTAIRLRNQNPSLDSLLDMLLTGDFEKLEPFLV